MRRTIIFAAVLLGFISARPTAAQPTQAEPSAAQPRPRAGFAWSVTADYLFRNAEYDASHNLFESSLTLHGIRVTPLVGVDIVQNEKYSYRFMAGLSMRKHMGDGTGFRDFFESPVAFFNFNTQYSGGRNLLLTVGIYPRSDLQSTYFGPLYSYGTIFTNPNLQGIHLRYYAPRFRTELALDWKGLLADNSNPDRREQFQILSSGDWAFAGAFHFGWEASFHHIACSARQYNVVDNHLVNPFIEFRPGGTWFDTLSVNAGAIVTYQWNREEEGGLRLPAGFYSRQALAKKGFFIKNFFYAGASQQPFRDNGTDWAPLMYNGLGMFRICADGAHWADEVMLGYAPQICPWMKLRVDLVFDFGSPTAGSGVYRGCAQVLGVIFNIDGFTK